MYEDRNNNNDDDENDDVLEFTSPSSSSSSTVSRSQRSSQQRNNSIDHHDDDQGNDYGNDAAVVVRTISASSDDNNNNNNNNDVEITDVVSGGGNSGTTTNAENKQKRNHPRNRNLDDFLEHAFQATKISSSRCYNNPMTSSSLSFPQLRSSMSYHAINDNDNSNGNSNVNNDNNINHNNNRTSNELEIGIENNEDNSHSSNDNNNNNSNTSAATIENNNINYNVSSSSNSSSISLSYLQFKKQWRYWCIMLSLGVANSSDASEILCISYILSDKVFQDNILNDSAFGSGLLTGSVFLGMLLGGLIVGTMGDWIGRKPMLLLGLICNSISGIISSMAWNVYILSFLRMISGIGIGATVPPLFTLATELSPPSIRGFNVTICASFWMVGSIFVAIIALYLFEIIPSHNNSNNDDESATTIYGIAIWRIFALICALPSALGAILVYWFVPESPRFLGVEGRSKEAVDVANLLVEKMGHQNDDDDGPLTIEELERTFPPSTIVDTTTVGGAGILGSTIGNGGSVGNGNGGGRIKDCIQFIQLAYIDFCSSTSKLYTTNKQIKQTTLALQMVWFALSFGSYGLLTWINIIFVKVHLENVYYNALLFAFSNLPGNILSGIYMDKIGRSKSLVGSIVLSSISLFFFAIFAEYEYSIGIVLSSCCFQCFTIMAWNTIDTMTSELFPTPCRSTGLGICAASGRIGALIAQFINGYLINSPVKLLLVASGTLLLGAITPYLLPNNGSRDMTGQPVNDTLQQEADVQVRRFIDDVDVDVGGNGNDIFAGVARRTNVNTTTARHRRYPSSENEDGFT